MSRPTTETAVRPMRPADVPGAAARLLAALGTDRRAFLLDELATEVVAEALGVRPPWNRLPRDQARAAERLHRDVRTRLWLPSDRALGEALRFLVERGGWP